MGTGEYGLGARRNSPRAVPVPLSAEALESLEDTVSVPVYDRRRVTTGTVHIGVGGFHRAHQALYLDRIMSEGAALDWGICGVGVIAADGDMRDALEAQGLPRGAGVASPGRRPRHARVPLRTHDAQTQHGRVP